jgi:arylsulfatase A-like enzyme
VDLKNEALKSCHAAYYGLINHVDDQICRVFRALGVDPVTGTAALDDTVIIFTSDHGEMLGDHHLFRKCYPYEGSARIPFLIRGPGVKTASVCDEPVCLEDIMPTVLDMAGVPIPDSVDGRSLVPLLHGESIAWRDFLHGEHATCYGEHQANHYLTDGREKYIWYSHSGREQLFDLFADPMELDDLAIVPDYSQHLAMWRNRLAHQLADRTEGFSDGYNLIAGRSHRAVLPAAEDVGVPVCV